MHSRRASSVRARANKAKRGRARISCTGAVVTLGEGEWSLSDGAVASDAVVCLRQCTEERKAHVVAQEARGLLGRMPKVQAD